MGRFVALVLVIPACDHAHAGVADASALTGHELLSRAFGVTT